MALSYKKRLLIDITGNDSLIFQTESGSTLAIGYERIVIGKRGPYIEFTKTQIDISAIFIPEKTRYRLTSRLVYYNEWRSNKDNVKIYEQKKTVSYADYKIGLWYISPFDLRVDGQMIIRPSKKAKIIDMFE